MSKQIQKVRISQLAKDLGVDWKDIKTKCESEGVVDQAKTASSTVSIGLAETIREWFGSGGVATATAVETTAKFEARPKPEPRTKVTLQPGLPRRLLMQRLPLRLLLTQQRRRRQLPRFLQQLPLRHQLHRLLPPLRRWFPSPYQQRLLRNPLRARRPQRPLPFRPMLPVPPQPHLSFPK